MQKAGENAVISNVKAQLTGTIDSNLHPMKEGLLSGFDKIGGVVAEGIAGMRMDRFLDNSHGYVKLSGYPSLFIKQKKTPCCPNCFGANTKSKTESKIATVEHRQHNVFHASELSYTCFRVVCPGWHSFALSLFVGDSEKDGELVASYERPYALPPMPCKCCCYQRIEVFDGKSKEKLGGVKETCWGWVPNFAVYNNEGHLEYNIRLSTCWGGICPNCFKESCFCPPFHIFSVEGGEPLGKISTARNVTGSDLVGFHRFECHFPSQASAESKARLAGASFLLNELYLRHVIYTS